MCTHSSGHYRQYSLFAYRLQCRNLHIHILVICVGATHGRVVVGRPIDNLQEHPLHTLLCISYSNRLIHAEVYGITQ